MDSAEENQKDQTEKSESNQEPEAMEIKVNNADVDTEKKDNTQDVAKDQTDQDKPEEPPKETVTVKQEEVPKDPVKTKKETELEKYWKPVRENPSDFTGWTYLLQYVEQEDDIDKAREAYDSFLAVYPYCYGYWKKYADLERRHNDLTKAVEVFETGLRSIPLSSDLWIHYISFHIKEFLLEEDTRRLYERAITAAGTDFRSDKLWNSYIEWEKDKEKVTAIYDRLLAIPTQLYSHHFDNFKRHVLNNHPKEVLSLDEFISLRTEVVKELGPEAAVDDEVPPGDDAPPGVETDSSRKGDAEEAVKVKEKILRKREEVFKRNEDEVSSRWVYEEGIKRPYFHVKPLERSQVKNWREYLDFEIQNGSHERVVVLFERCMIAAALYEDFWLKYARYLEENVVGSKKKSVENGEPAEEIKEAEDLGYEAVRNVYRRACRIHLPKKPYIHMAWAAFEERQGKHNDAWQILANLDVVVPGMVMIAMRRISLERRIGNREKTEILFQDYIEKAPDINIRTFYVIKYARYLFKVSDIGPSWSSCLTILQIQGDEIKAKAILMEAIDKDPTNEKLYIQLLDMEYQKQPVNVLSALEIFSKAINTDQLSLTIKIKMSQRRLEFLEDFGLSILQLKECYDEHQKLLKDLNTQEKKRKGTDTNSSAAPPEKKAKPSNNGTGDHQTTPDYSAYWAAYNNQYYQQQQQAAWGPYSQYYQT